ncbi:MAG: LysM peptidoglycan-binding domain-containing protein [Anaerolineae bacterium]|nr:LysM peptidoglycan-binding domain-containing protein [Anaerolineae bacterium]
MNKPPSSMISSYKKRQQMGPFVVGGLAILLIAIAIVLLVMWLTGSGAPKFEFNLFATETPTPTLTFTPTNTNTRTSTPTETATPTITFTPTPSAPFEYTIQEGEFLFAIIEKFNLGDNGLALLLLLNTDQAGGRYIDPVTLGVSVGQVIWIPNPDMPLPTATPVPLETLRRGAKINYTVQAGDTIAGIAFRFNSTTADILKENGLTEADLNLIYIGQILIIPVNMVTPVNTLAPTVTPGPTITPTATP